MKMRWLLLPLFAASLIAGGCTSGIPVATDPATVEASQGAAEAPIPLPTEKDSLKFAVLGDYGTGGTGQYELAAEMARVHEG
ncbi:MAG: hypothetical protein Q7W29_01970, partial [bacterium]|nr:hypothetical protein [bacterium]